MKLKLGILTFGLLVATGLHAAETNASAPLLLDGVAAEVGEARVTIAETMLLAREMAAARQIPLAEQATRLRDLYAEAQDALVGRQLILQAYAAAPQKLPDWVVDRRVAAVIDEHFGGDRSQLVSMLNKQGMGYDFWRKRLEEELAVSTMRQQFVDQNVVVAPADVRAYYATNRTAFALDGAVKVGMILIAERKGETHEATAARAAQVLTRLQAGQDFGEVARLESSDAHAKSGGDWGYVDPDELFRKEIVDTLAGLKIGQIGGPIETESGFYIVSKLAERPKDGFLPLEAAWAEIEARLHRDQAVKRYARWIESLKRNTTVRIYPLP